VGLSTEGLCEKHGERTAAFTGVLDKHGDFFCGVADMVVLNFIPKEHLDQFHFWESRIVLLDSNIGEETLGYVLSRTQKCQHIIYEPISQEKSERILIKDFFSKITIFKPNLVQLRHLMTKLVLEKVKDVTKSPEEIFKFKGTFYEDEKLIKGIVTNMFKYAYDVATRFQQ
jgi:hypothetical protein